MTFENIADLFLFFSVSLGVALHTARPSSQYSLTWSLNLGVMSDSMYYSINSQVSAPSYELIVTSNVLSEIVFASFGGRAEIFKRG